MQLARDLRDLGLYSRCAQHMREAAQHVAEETFADLAEVRCVAPPLLVRRSVASAVAVASPERVLGKADRRPV